MMRWSPDDGVFETIIDLESSKQIGYQTYNFPAVTTESLTFMLVSNHGGAIFEVTDIKVCAESTTADNTAYGSDDDGGQNLDSFMQLEVTGPTEIRIDVSNLFAGLYRQCLYRII